MQTTTFRARRIPVRITSQLQALRLIWSGRVDGGDQADWAALTDGLELLTATQIQQRFAAEGIEIALDVAAELQIEAVEQRPSGVLPIVQQDDEHAIASVDVRDGAGNHVASVLQRSILTIDTGGLKDLWLVYRESIETAEELLKLYRARKKASPAKEALLSGYAVFKIKADGALKRIVDRGGLLVIGGAA